MTKKTISLEAYREDSRLLQQAFESKAAKEVQRLIDERQQTLERLAELCQTRMYPAVAVLYMEKDNPTVLYQALGLLGEFRVYDPNIKLINGLSYTQPLYMPADNKMEIVIPSNQVLNYSVLQMKQEIQAKPKKSKIRK